MVLSLLTQAGGFLKAAAPALSFASAISGGGQRQTLQRAATAAAGFGNTGTNIGQQTAKSIADGPASETSTSGSTDAQNLIINLGDRTTGGIVPASYGMNVPSAGRGSIQQANLPAIIGGGTAAARSIGGMLGLAGGAIMVAPTIIDMVTGEEKKLRVTRRLRSQVKQAVMMFGVEVVAENMGTTPEVIFYILTKKMRNDGAYVTKAAVRKTRQTVRKMKHLCDMYDDLRPPARRAPARRTASKTTLIKN
tara:strand:- start:27 stop:776 length:750 start_codon:yes stop_codon:yes gene_type:complete